MGVAGNKSIGYFFYEWLENMPRQNVSCSCNRKLVWNARNWMGFKWKNDHDNNRESIIITLLPQALLMVINFLFIINIETFVNKFYRLNNTWMDFDVSTVLVCVAISSE